jgi:hypothetical protein
VGNLEGLTELAGFDWENGLGNAEHAWNTLLELGVDLSPFGQGAVELNDLVGLPFLHKGELSETLKNAGETFVGWNDWKDDPAYAGGELAGNIGALLVARGASSGLKALPTAAKASDIAAVARVGAALDRLMNLPKLGGGRLDQGRRRGTAHEQS